MRKEYAIVENNKVINKAVVDTSQQPFDIPSNWYQSKVAKKRDILNPNTGEYTTPPPQPEPPREINLNEELTRAEKVKQINQMVADGVLTTARAAEIKGA